MRAAIFLRDVVGETEHRFLVGIGPLQGDVNGDAVHLTRDGDDVRVQRRLHLRQVFDERTDSAFKLEHIAARVIRAAMGALISQRDAYAGIEERQFTQPLGEDAGSGDRRARCPATGARTVR
jgi:hypothetical protein